MYQVRSPSPPISFSANRQKQVETSKSEGVALRLWGNIFPRLAFTYGELKHCKQPENQLTFLLTGVKSTSALQPDNKKQYHPMNHL